MDKFGNPTSLSAPVSLAIGSNPGGSTLGGTTTANPGGGVATFTGLTLNKVATGYTLVATSGTLSVTTGAINVTPAAAAQLVIPASGEPAASATAGTTLSLVVDVEDAYGNAEPTYSGSVAIALAGGATGTLAGTLTASASKGVATFSDFQIDTAGTFQLAAASSGLSPVTSSSITVGPAAAAKIVWAAQPPSTVTVGLPFGATANVEDQFGNIESGDSQNVSIALDLNGNPDSGDLGGTSTVAASGGAAAFSNLVINAVGNPFTLVASSGGLTSPASGPIDVVSAQLVVTGQPATSLSAGEGFTITVTAETTGGAKLSGFSGTVSLSVASGPSGSTIKGPTSVIATGGVATFANVSLDTVGVYELQAASSLAGPGDTNPITVVADSTVAGLYIEQQPPASVQAGAGFGLVVGGLDQFGNPTPLSGQVAVAIGDNPGGGSLGGTATATASGGSATFSGLTLDTVGTGYTLVASSSTLPTVTTGAISVTPAAASKLVIPTSGEPPANVLAGQSFAVVVDVEDQYGNLVPGFQGSVTIAQPGTITGTITLTVTGAQASFSNLAIDTVGTYKIVTTSGTLSPATSSSITVAPASDQPAELAWATEPPGQVTRSLPFGAAIDVQDQYGNLETGYTGSVAMALEANPGGATLGGTTSVSVSNGVATFPGLTISNDGNGYTLVAGAGGVSSQPSSTIDVSLIPAVSLEISTQPPSSLVDTQSFALSVTALDQSGHPDPDFVGEVFLTIATPAGDTGLGGTTTATASGGVANFSGLSLQSLGTYTLEATSRSLVPATTNKLTITAGPATQLVIGSQPPTSVVAGTTFSVEVQAEDSLGNPASSFNGDVTAALTANAGGVTLTGPPLFQAMNGTVTFTGQTVQKAGSGYTIQFTAAGLTAATTAAFGVTAGTPSKLVVAIPPPSSVTAGTPFGLTVAITDTYGNLETSDDSPITISMVNKQAAGPLGGQVNVNATGGQATFSNLVLDQAVPNDSIQATSSGVGVVITSAFAVAPAAARTLDVTAQPPLTMDAGSPFGLAIAVEDVYGNVVTPFSGNVTLTLYSPSGQGHLSGGPLTMPASGGIVGFPPNLSIDKAGTGYEVVAMSPALSSASTLPITVLGLPSTQLAIEVEPPSTLAPARASAWSLPPWTSTTTSIPTSRVSSRSPCRRARARRSAAPPVFRPPAARPRSRG